MPDQNDPQGERTRVDVAEYRKIHLGTLEVGTDGAITIRPPSKADTPGETAKESLVSW
jgi:hypothetical protein